MSKSTLTAFCVAAALAANLCAQSVSFYAPLNFSAFYESGGPISIVQGDFNGDGRPDVAASFFGGEVQIFLNEGGGYLRKTASYSISRDDLWNIAVGDFNHDGKLDLAVVVFGAGVSILFGNGDGTFEASVNYNVGPNPYNVEVGDFDKDGRLDLAVTTSAGIAILINRGDGTFREPVNYGSDPYLFMAVGDFNGDGYPDLAAVDTATNTVGLMLNLGNGTFGPATSVGAGPVPFDLAAADLNGDGHLDLAVTNPGANTISILFGNGSGGFMPAQTLAAQSANALAVVDLNHDGIPDLAALVTDGFSVFLGTGGGTFAAPVNYAAPPAGTFVARDFNSDGKPDILLGTGLYTLSLFLGNGDGTLRTPSSITIPGSEGVNQSITADFNHDGKLDLAICNPPNVSILLGNGDGTFQPAIDYALGSYPAAIAPADFNGDGRLDLAVTDSSGVWILLGNGDGTFQNPVSYAAGPYPASIAIADFNGDGKLDIAVGDNGRGRYSVSVLLGNGDGTFRPFIPHAIHFEPYALVAGDFNGDGLPDVAVAGQGPPGALLVLQGTGDGHFRNPVQYSVSTPYGAPGALVASDFNGDGKLDLAFEAYSPRALYVMLGSGDGTFQTPVAYSTTLGYGDDWWAGGLAVGDFNGDGHPDIVGTAGGNTVAIYLGRGDGTFQQAKYFGTDLVYFIAGTGDFNGDGKADIAITGGAQLSIMMNTTK